MADPTFDQEAAHRWFAIEYNNRAWDLIEQNSRSDDERDEMLHVAHASWVHWKAVGNELNLLRAECLLATAYAVAEIPEPGLRYARSCVARCDQPDIEMTTFDHACAVGCLARLLSLSGQSDEAAEQAQLAASIADGLSDAGEQQVYASLYGAASSDG